MKLVLASSRQAYDRFIEKIWSKDKDVSIYRYISNVMDLQGLARDAVTKVVKVGNYRDHPNYDQIIDEVEFRFDRNSMRESSGFQSQGTTMMDAYQENVNHLVSQRSILSDRISPDWDLPSYGTTELTPRLGTEGRIIRASTPPEPITVDLMNETVDRIRGMHMDSAIYGEFNGLREQLTREDLLRQYPIRGVTPPSAIEYQAEFIGEEDGN